MKYKKFYIENFKGIEKLDIDLSNNRIITLVGLNESGKTTIMEALNAFYRLTKDNKLTGNEKNSFRPKGIDFTGTISIRGTAEFEPNDTKAIQEYIKTLKLPYGVTVANEPFEIDYKFLYKLHNYEKSEVTVTLNATAIVKSDNEKLARKKLYDYDNSKWNDLVNYIESKLLPEVLYYEDFVFHIPEEVIYKATPDPIGTQEQEKNLTWQLVLDDIIKTINPSFTTFQAMVVDIWQKDNDTALNRISQIEEVLNKKITNSWKALFQKESNQVNFKEIKIAPKIENSDFKVSFKVKTDTGKLFSINDRSKGCRWFFSFLIFTEFRKHRTKNILFLLDEPASNLHSSAQVKILEAITELSQGSIVIYSTHSHHLINPKWLGGAYIVINDNLSEATLKGDMTFKESSKINVLKYFNYVGLGYGKTNVSYFQPILDALDYAPSSVEAFSKLIITEGKSDWFAFNYMNETILKRERLNFYPGAGKDSLYDIIRLYLAWGSKFAVILDSDAPSSKSKKDYIKEFSPLLDSKIFTLQDAVGIKGSLEDLFSEDDTKKIVLSNFTKEIYNNSHNNPPKLKELFNSSLNILAFNKTYIELSENTKNNFIKLIDFLTSKIN